MLLGSERLARAVPLTDVDLTFDGTAQVEAQGSCSIVRSPLRGESWIPAEPGDMLAPFGAELAIVARVVVPGLVDERIPMGVYPLTEVPDSAAGLASFGGAMYVVAERIDLAFKDRMHGVVEDRFTRPEAPGAAPTCYAELERLTGRTVARTVSDRPIRSGIFYDKERDQAVEEIAGILGGVPFFNSAGELQVRPDKPGAVVATLAVEHVSPVSAALSTEGVYNGIVVTGKSESGAEIRVEMWLSRGPLAPDRWGRRVPKEYHSDYLYTQPMVVAEAERQLAELARPAARRVAFEALPHPLLEVGDVVQLRQPTGEVLTARLLTIRAGAGTWPMTGELL